MNNMWRLDAEGSKLLAVVDRIARETIEPLAAMIDREGRFPRENVEALRQAGLL